MDFGSQLELGPVVLLSKQWMLRSSLPSTVPLRGNKKIGLADGSITRLNASERHSDFKTVERIDDQFLNLILFHKSKN